MKKILMFWFVFLIGAVVLMPALAEEPATPAEKTEPAENAEKPAPAPATEDEGRKMVLRFGLHNMYQKGTDFGFGADFDWYFHENLSFNPSIGYVKITDETHFKKTETRWDEGNLIQYSLGLNIHQSIHRFSDLRLGPVVGSMSIPGGDNAFCLGWGIGVDLGIGKSKWAASLNARYLREWQGEADGFFFQLGAAYRF